MATDCPVCGDVAEHFRRERPGEDAASGPTTSIEVDELCAGGEERWDRICHSARLQDVDGTPVALLEAYYHYAGDPGD